MKRAHIATPAPKPRKRIRRSSRVLLMALVILGILTTSTLGFIFLEDYSLINAFYMTIITVSTVGFGEIQPLSPVGRLFTSGVIISSLGTFAYAITTVSQYILSGELREYLKHYKVNKKLEKIRDHVIVCGYGRNGRQAVEELLALGKEVVIIDQDGLALQHLAPHPNLAFVLGNAIQDETMVHARIGRAKALITTLPNDADNLFVVLSARELNPRLTIISRASEDHAYAKLKRGGADNVIMPDKVGGIRMAKLVAQPDIVEFIENILLHQQDEVNLEEITCEDMPYCNINRALRTFRIRENTGATIIGLKTADGGYIFNPSLDFKLSPEDKLFALGTPRQIENLKKALTDQTQDDQTAPQNRFTHDDPREQLL